jgi:hypothetical protein
LNDDVLKPLKDLHLGKEVPSIVGLRQTICDDYRFVVILPTDTYLYNAALLHLKLSATLAGGLLDNLPMTLNTHNRLADSTEVAIQRKLTDGLASRKLEYARSEQAVWSILQLLSDFWRQYRLSIFETITSDRARLLDYFRRTFPRNDDGHLLNLGTYAVWDERQQGEKEKVIELIEGLVQDPEIVIDLWALEDSKGKLETVIKVIAIEAGKISKAIDADAYTGKADCCYALVPRLIRYLVR